MTSAKLILKNVRKNARDYQIYFLTLMLSISLFYAFNAITDQPALLGQGAVSQLLIGQLGILISVLSFAISVVLAFLIVYSNNFLLKRRKKELGVYMLLGMRKGKISRIFVAETLLMGVVALISGIVFGALLSQGLNAIALKLFSISLNNFRLVISLQSMLRTVLCFVAIFFVVMISNASTISKVKLIDLFTATRKNEDLGKNKLSLEVLKMLASIALIAVSVFLFEKNGILPSRETHTFYFAVIALGIGTLLLFSSLSFVILRMVQKNKGFYLRGLNSFLVRQLSAKIRSNYLVMTVVCALLFLTICSVTIGSSIGLSMNSLSKAATPYSLNVISSIKRDGDSNIKDYLKTKDLDIDTYAEAETQISLYEADITYSELFGNKELNLWSLDKDLPQSNVSLISLSDFNKAMLIQGKNKTNLNDNQFMINCNYKGTFAYVEAFLKARENLTVAGEQLSRANDQPLSETFFMTAVGNNDRGTLIVPDHVVERLTKDINVLLVQYKAGVETDEILKKLVPIGLDESHGYRYAERNMMYDMFYGSNALVSFLALYIGLVFLLICSAVLALKQLTETTDNVYSYGLLRKIGASEANVNKTIFWQIGVFFMVPLLLASVFSLYGIRKLAAIVEDFMNIPVTSNLFFTSALLVLVYGGYFLITYKFSKRIIKEQK